MNEPSSDAGFLSERRGAAVHLTLDRPDALNALTREMLLGLTRELSRAAREASVRAIVLSGAGRAFCAGADLGRVRERQARGRFEHGDELRGAFNPLIVAIRRVEKPVIAAVRGTAAGAGASLALACDLKICASDAKFINAFAKVGLVPDSGMSWMLPRAMGLSAALEHAWLSRSIDAEKALRLGLVNRVVAPEDLDAAVVELCTALAAVPPLAVALTKRAFNRGLESSSLEDQLEYEAQLQSHLGRTKDHAEGVAAFLEKRPPAFRGE